uniref:MYND-type domain-containing protein n=1 Tax=Mycena chlorophos TaxID=658473 RepID=A0ABQ0LNE8_MYCCL|nr:predicted protein [Mycena chlorophos]
MASSLVFTAVQRDFQLHAKALIAGSANEDDMHALVRYIDRRSTTSNDAEYTLPAFYAVLDPSHLPREPSEIDALEPTRMRTAYQAFTVLGAKPDILFSDGLARAFWPRVLRWAVFFCTYGVAIPGVQHIPDFDADVFAPAISIITKLLLSCDEPRDLLPGIDEPDAIFICARGWSLLATGPEDYPVLLNFVSVLFPRCAVDAYPSRLASLLEGAYGYDGLAKLLLQGMEFLLKQARRDPHPFSCLDDPVELVRLIQDVEPMLSLRSGALLPVDIAHHPPSRFTLALIDHDAVYILARSAYLLFHAAPEGIEPVGYTLLALLSRLISYPTGHDRAQDTGQYLVRAPTLKISWSSIAPLFSQHSSAPNELSALDRPTVAELLQDPVFRAWSSAHGVWDPVYASMCDNLSIAERQSWGSKHPLLHCGSKCSNISCPREVSDDFKKCGGCSTLRYCSVACQKIDWRTGGHRTLCAAYRLLHQCEGAIQMLFFSVHSLSVIPSDHRHIGLSRAQHNLLCNAFADWHLGRHADPDKTQRAADGPGKTITHIDFSELGDPGITIDTIDFPSSPPSASSEDTLATYPDHALRGVIHYEGDIPPGAGAVWSDMIRRGRASGGILKLVAIHFARGVPAYGGTKETLVVLVVDRNFKRSA